jgi:hypothetical protein
MARARSVFIDDADQDDRERQKADPIRVFTQTALIGSDTEGNSVERKDEKLTAKRANNRSRVSLQNLQKKRAATANAMAIAPVITRFIGPSEITRRPLFAFPDQAAQQKQYAQEGC